MMLGMVLEPSQEHVQLDGGSVVGSGGDLVSQEGVQVGRLVFYLPLVVAKDNCAQKDTCDELGHCQLKPLFFGYVVAQTNEEQL